MKITAAQRIHVIDYIVKLARSERTGDAAQEIDALARRLGVSKSFVRKVFAEEYAKGNVDRYIAALEGC